MSTSDTLGPGALIEGRFKILSVLGEGGFGVVFKAEQISTGQEVAVKVMHPRHLKGSDAASQHADRFRREMMVIARLKHPNIVRLFDSGELEDGTLYAVIEYVDGRPLGDIIEEHGALREADAIRIMSQVLDALACAHEAGVVHRDLKPDNIMVTTTGARKNALVLDFGIAGVVGDGASIDPKKLTSTGQFMGTPVYMAPEQLTGEPTTSQTDIYAWGLMFVEALTGTVAVDGISLPAILMKQMSDEPIPIPHVLDGTPLGAVLRKATAKSLRDRYPTCRDALDDLERCEPTGLLSNLDRHKDVISAEMAVTGDIGSEDVAAAITGSGNIAHHEGRQTGDSLDRHTPAAVEAPVVSTADSSIVTSSPENPALPAPAASLSSAGNQAVASAGNQAGSPGNAAVSIGSHAAVLGDPAAAPPSKLLWIVLVMIGLVVVAGAVLFGMMFAGDEGEGRTDDPERTIAEADGEPDPSEDDGVAGGDGSTKGKATGNGAPSQDGGDPVPSEADATPTPAAKWVHGNLYDLDDKRRSRMVFHAGSTGFIGVDADVHASILESCGRWPNLDCPPDMFKLSMSRHEVTVPGYFLDETEVSNADYDGCVSAGDCAALEWGQCELFGPKGNFSKHKLPAKQLAQVQDAIGASLLPATCVTRVEAASFCAWAGKRLPSEAEWELAASNGGVSPFPWGADDTALHGVANGADTALAAAMARPWKKGTPIGLHTEDDGHAFAAPVAEFSSGASSAGVKQLSGNVREWIADDLVAYPGDNLNVADGTGVTRGGGWAETGPRLNAHFRFALPSDTRRADTGFRCAISESDAPADE